MRYSKRFGLYATLGAALVAAACTAIVVEEDGPGRPLPDRPQVCPELYAPVCGDRRGRQRTYGNLCEADADRARVLYRGECRISEPQPRPRPEPDDVCPQIYGPVCGIRGGQFRQFDNSCVAVKSGYRVVSEGEGSCDRFSEPPEEPRACTREYRPVCGTLPSGRERTFGNACEADAAGARIRFSGEC